MKYKCQKCGMVVYMKHCVRCETYGLEATFKRFKDFNMRPEKIRHSVVLPLTSQYQENII